LGHRRARPGRLILVALAAVGASAAAAQGPLRAQRWLAPGPAARGSLTHVPAECLARPVDPEAALAVEVGRAAFRTPVLLGGQAARAGLSCEACHRGGRSNPQFLFPGLSGAPGTADVTASLFSSHRGNGVFDPRPIPDLSGAKSTLKIDQSPRSRALEGFIHGLVTQEFDGPEPSPSVLAGLATYVRALDPAACPPAPDPPLTAGLYLDDARRAARAALSLADRGDAPGAELMVAAARARLGLIHERFAGPGLAAERERLRRADHALAAVAEALREGRPVQAPLRRWLADSWALERALSRREAASLFNPARLAASASPLPPQSR
jgi:hypothetical protein